MKQQKMGKKIVKNGLIGCLLLLVFVAAGCSKRAGQETLLVAGSTTMLPYMEKLEKGFNKMHPQILVESDGGGSTAGIIAVKRNAIDLAMTSREVKPEEDDQYLRDYLVAKDAIAIVVHPSNPVRNLNKEQIKDVFTGVITNWRQLGGADAPIVLIGRNKASTTRKGMDEMVLGGLDFAKEITANESAEILTAAVAGNVNAVGYLALKDLKPAIKPLTINNIAISRESILSGNYPLSRSFYLEIYDKPKSAVQKLIDFTLSKEGQDILEQEGLIRVN
ncbi:MAG TPA: phosphate ABC transporter substrate-binding protein [Patescibacteria group bacterium]|nr:phosphate ABC transporter substrate-binding protein [Patescibacteria group bacterium]